MEDDAHIRTVLVDFLEQDGLEIVEASTAEAALLLLDSGTTPCAIITDINLGSGATGVELADMLRLRDAAIPVIFITGRIDMLHQRGLRSGEHIIAKPFALSTLLRMVQRVLQD